MAAWPAPCARRYTNAFSAGYRDRFSPADAVGDMDRIEAVLNGRGPAAKGTLLAHVYEQDGNAPDAVNLKLFVHGDFIPLSQCLPVFENLGVKVIAEDAFSVTPLAEDGTAQHIAVQNILTERADGHPADIERLKPLLEDAFHAVWNGASGKATVSTALVIAAELPWRDVVILRAIAKFLRQAGFSLSQTYVESALAKNPDLAVRLVRLFHTLFDPSSFASNESRAQSGCQNPASKSMPALTIVPSADDDRFYVPCSRSTTRCCARVSSSPILPASRAASLGLQDREQGCSIFCRRR
jgi:glutamate dehydrogenase